MDLAKELRKQTRSSAIMVRLTPDEYKEIKKIASRYQVSLGETMRTLSLKMLGQVMMGAAEVKKNKKNK